MKRLSFDVFGFLYWWAITAPKYIFTLCKRFLTVANHEAAFTVNLLLLVKFVPLFGDYTWIGRFIGVIFRILWLIVGLAVVSIVFILNVVLPILWYFLPFISLYYLNILTIPLIIVVFVLKEFWSFNIPFKRVSEVSQGSLKKSFRTTVLEQINLIDSTGAQALHSFYRLEDVQIILKRAELLNQDFLDKLITSFEYSSKDELIDLSYQIAKKHGTRYVELEHLFLAILQKITKLDLLLATYGSSYEIFESTIAWVVDRREELSKILIWQPDYEIPGIGGTNRGLTGRVTKYLDKYSEDYTANAQLGLYKKIIGREEEIDRIANLLSGNAKVNVIMVGEPGCGKTAIVKAIAQSIIHGTEYASLRFKRIVELDPGFLIAGAKTPGDIAERLKGCMEDAKGSGDIIVFIDEIHNLVGGTNSQNVDLASVFTILEPYLVSNRIQFIASTNIANYRKYIEPNRAFSRLFERIDIQPTSEEVTLKILESRAIKMEKDYNIVISYPALKKAIELSKKLIHEKVFPDKAVEVLKRASLSRGKRKGFLSDDDIAEEISELTHVPVGAITQDESEKLLNIENELKQMVIGQDPAVIKVAKALKRARVGIRNEGKPIASFLFVGTTGVGKTQTAKALAASYFGDAKAMIRIDMSEYQQADSINKLIGDSYGNNPGILTDSVRNKPFSLILLDEIEKAYSNVLLTFLQVLDDGRLTDASGRVVDFTNTIIIATSNVGTRALQDIARQGGTFEQMENAAMKEVQQKFAPEFLNRFSGIIVYKPLSIETVKQIAHLLLANVQKMVAAKNINVTYSPELIDALVKKGFNPELGARPLARVIEDTIETYLATKMLSNELKMGDTVELGMEVFELE